MPIAYILVWMSMGVIGIALHQWPFQVAFVTAGALGYWLAQRGGTPFRDGRIYIASRLTKNNLLFPTQMAVLPERVIWYKAELFGYREESISIAQVASVKLRKGLFFSDVNIESTGGQNQEVCHDLKNDEAVLAKQEIEAYQQAHFNPPTQGINA